MFKNLDPILDKDEIQARLKMSDEEKWQRIAERFISWKFHEYINEAIQQRLFEFKRDDIVFEYTPVPIVKTITLKL